MSNFKSKTVTKEYADGTTTTEKAGLISYEVLRKGSFRHIDLSEFVELADSRVVEFLNSNYPEYAEEGFITAEDDNSSFIIKYGTGFEDEEMLIHITESTVYFDKTTHLYKVKGQLSIQYSIINSWILHVYNDELVYEFDSFHVNGDDFSVSANFKRNGLLSADKTYRDKDDENYTVSRHMWADLDRFAEEECTTVYDKGKIIKETVEYKTREGNFPDKGLLREITEYEYDDKKEE